MNWSILRHLVRSIGQVVAKRDWRRGQSVKGGKGRKEGDSSVVVRSSTFDVKGRDPI